MTSSTSIAVFGSLDHSCAFVVVFDALVWRCLALACTTPGSHTGGARCGSRNVFEEGEGEGEGEGAV